MAKRCQVCDGPVKGDRCVLCGMFYRKDEELYHLNESRSAHYRHASESAKKIMRAQETALPDKRAKEIENKQAVQTLGEVLKQEAQRHKMDRLYAEQKKRLAPKKMEKSKSTAKSTFNSSAAENKTFSMDVKKLVSEKANIEYQTQSVLERMRKRKVGIALSAILVIMAIQAFDSYSTTDFRPVSSNSNFDREESLLSVESEWYDDSEYMTLEEALSETEEGYFLNSFYMYPEDGIDLIGKSPRCTVFHPEESMSDWEPGYYMAVMKESSGILRISSEYRVCEEYVSYKNNNYLVFELENGENVEFQNAGDKYAEVYIYSIDMAEAI